MLEFVATYRSIATWAIWEPVSADAIQIPRSVGLRFRTWIVWDKLQAGIGTHRGSIDSAAAPNVTAPVESVLVFYRGSWYRSGPAAMPHDAWLELCGPRGLWRFHGTSDPLVPAPFPEELPLRCITLFSLPGDVVADPFVGAALPPRRLPASDAWPGPPIAMPPVWPRRAPGSTANELPSLHSSVLPMDFSARHIEEVRTLNTEHLRLPAPVHVHPVIAHDRRTMPDQDESQS